MKHMMIMSILTLLVSSVRAEIFRDDFNDGDLKGWTFMQGAEHGRIQDSALVLSSPNPKAEFGAEAVIAVDGVIASDYEVSVSVKISRLVKGILHGPHVGLRAHIPPRFEPFIKSFQGNKTLRTLLYGQSYKFILGYQDIGGGVTERGFGATIQHVEVSKKGDRRNIKSEVRSRAFRLFDFRLHKWYRLKLIAEGNRFQCFIDDIEMLNFFDDTYTAGKIYLSSGWGNRVHFDDFEVQYEALSVQPRRQLTTIWGEIKGDLH
ncbi:DUF1080 domain-containing protein [Candidatus Poribacteria bacterium]|nr:DUF1080 domain-containing protein [Candidatus Poribacteria bacterium]